MNRLGLSVAVALTAAALMACSSQKPAPVVDRSGTGPARPQAAVGDKPGPRTAKDGVYTAQRGDTLNSVATAW